MKTLQWMHCPKCGQALQTEHHSAVEIDVCPDGRTVCLDSTALEAIVAPRERLPPFLFAKLSTPSMHAIINWKANYEYTSIETIQNRLTRSSG